MGERTQESVVSDQARRLQAIQLRILTEPDHFRYVRRNAANRASHGGSLTLKEVVALLEEAIVLSVVAGCW